MASKAEETSSLRSTKGLPDLPKRHASSLWKQRISLARSSLTLWRSQSCFLFLSVKK